VASCGYSARIWSPVSPLATRPTTVARQNVDVGTRDELLSRLAEAVWSVTVAHHVRYAVDGPHAAGKPASGSPEGLQQPRRAGPMVPPIAGDNSRRRELN
jgi:hypothetical protein